MDEAKLLDVLNERFGFGSFRAGQLKTIQSLLGQRAALAVFPTGAGKSLCYQLPALVLEGITLVVSPLIALMKDQIDFLRSRGIAAEKLDSSLTATEALEIVRRIRDGETKLLYVAPERFNNERFLDLLGQIPIALFAVDEAHCISEWGHNFRPDYLKLASTAKAVGAERVLALTATATPNVVNDICAAFEIPKSSAVVTGFYRPNLTLLTRCVLSHQRDRLILDRLKSRPPGSTIIYVTLQKQAERLSDFLSQNGIPSAAYHAGVESDVRTAIQDWWRSGADRVVVATIAFGMGIDKADVRYVYHANLPKSLEGYSQEIGRAGRDGLPAIVEVFASAVDIPDLENFVYGDTPSEGAIRSLLRDILAKDDEFSVSILELSSRHDIRQLVVRTALTYLELGGAIRKGTPFYSSYEWRTLVPEADVISAFPGVHGEFVESIFAQAKRGRIWFKLDPDSASHRLGVERKRLVKALDVMNERGLIELRASDVRDRITKTPSEKPLETWVTELMAQFMKRERNEIERLDRVRQLVELDGCQVRDLVGYFGEHLASSCGHCTFCLEGKPAHMLEEISQPDFDSEPGWDKIISLVERNPEVLDSPRSVARFLAGISSPKTSRTRLSRDPFFGSLQGNRFGQILEWVERNWKEAR